jgi:hypothetical protein
MVSNQDNATWNSAAKVQGELTISSSSTTSITVAEDITGLTTLYILNDENTSDYLAVAGTVSGTVGSQVFTFDTPLLSPATSASDEGKWVNASLVISDKPKEITLEASTTTTSIESLDMITTGDSLLVYNATDGMVERTAGSVTTGSVDTVNQHDIFGDGSCLATYQLDGNANDLGGNYDGIATGISYETGKSGQASNFSTTGSIIDTPDINMDSISFWMKPSVTFGVDTNIQGSLIKLNPGAIYLGSNYSQSMSIFGAGNNPSDRNGINNTFNNNQWYHVVVNWEIDRYEFYVDGIKQTKVGNNATTKKIFTGMSRPVTGGYCSLDQVRIFNKSLTSTEITSLYNETAIKYQAPIEATTVPATKAFFNNPTTYSLAVEDTANRCIAKDEVLDFVSSTTTEYVGTNPISGLLKTGDTIQLDGTTEVVTSDVVESVLSLTNNIGNVGALITLSNNNTTATRDSSTTYGANSNIYGDHIIQTQARIYFEADGANWIGLCADNTKQDIEFNRDISGYSFRGNSNIENNNVVLTYGDTFTTSDRIGVEYNRVSGEIIFYINGTSQGIAYTIAPIDMYPALCNSLADSVSNFYGSSDTILYLPTGAIPYDEAISQYTCAIPTQASAPTSAKVLDRSTVLTTTKTYNAGNNNFDVTMDSPLDVSGRALKLKVDSAKAGTTVDIDTAQINLSKEP